MGGPAISVIYKNTSSVEIRHRVYRWIRKIGSISDKYEDGYGFYVRNGSVRDFPELGEHVGCRVTLIFESFKADDVELLTIESHLGYFPEGQITISAGCNSTVDSIVIGEIASHIASTLDGFVLMFDAIALDEVDRPGVKFHIPTLNVEGSYNYYTLADHRFLRSLLSQDTFYLV